MTEQLSTGAQVITPEELRRHWQGHRGLTRRVIEAFPEPELFSHSIGGLRTFGELSAELLGMAVPIVRGLATGEWTTFREAPSETKEELLRRWDEATAELDRYWADLRPEAFHEVHNAFGQWEGPGYWQVFYAIDNEIHHRGQGYVYLRSLGIEPPPFYER
jgi:uncharacterized damage-inducible protein DinB